MRNISLFLLSLVILAATFIPCCLADDCAQEQDSGLCQHPDDDQDADKGTCSPFFACGSCNSAVEVVQSFIPAKPLQVTPSVYPVVNDSRLSQYQALLLQPPRLG